MPVDSSETQDQVQHNAHDAEDYELKYAALVAAIIFSVVLLVGLVGVMQMH